jgi:hypothetical protein
MYWMGVSSFTAHHAGSYSNSTFHFSAATRPAQVIHMHAAIVRLCCVVARVSAAVRWMRMIQANNRQLQLWVRRTIALQ